MNKHKMAKIIYPTYQTNSFKIIRSTFIIYELPHAPVIFPSVKVYSIVLKIPTELKVSDKLCRFTDGGGRLSPRPTWISATAYKRLLFTL